MKGGVLKDAADSENVIMLTDIMGKNETKEVENKAVLVSHSRHELPACC